MFKKIYKHMPKLKENPVDHIKVSKEDKMPDLADEYWANPNSSKGVVKVCSYGAGIKEISKYKEGL